MDAPAAFPLYFQPYSHLKGSFIAKTSLPYPTRATIDAVCHIISSFVRLRATCTSDRDRCAARCRPIPNIDDRRMSEPGDSLEPCFRSLHSWNGPPVRTRSRNQRSALLNPL